MRCEREMEIWVEKVHQRSDLFFSLTFFRGKEGDCYVKFDNDEQNINLWPMNLVILANTHAY